MTVALLATTAVAPADPETPRVDSAQIERENLQRLQLEQQRIENEHMELRRARLAEKQALALEELALKEHEHQREVRASRRRSGYVLIGFALALGGGALFLGKLGENQNDAILEEQVEFPHEIEQRENRGRLYNYGAYGALGLAGLFVVISVPLIVLNLDVGEYSVVPVATDTGAGAALTGRF